MDELQKAVSQFYPSSSGGMYGGSSAPSGPSGPSESAAWFFGSSDELRREQEVGSGPAHPQLPSSSFYNHAEPSEGPSRVGSIEMPLEVDQGDEEFPPPRSFWGESISEIWARLFRHSKKDVPDFDQLSTRAEASFEMKKKILSRLDHLDPAGGWLLDGAPLLKNQRSGAEYPLRKLKEILQSLEGEGHNSRFLNDLFSRKDR